MDDDLAYLLRSAYEAGIEAILGAISSPWALPAEGAAQTLAVEAVAGLTRLPAGEVRTIAQEAAAGDPWTALDFYAVIEAALARPTAEWSATATPHSTALQAKP